MYESPRIRRLRNDLAALDRLKEESSVLRFRGRGSPVQHYLIEFHGNSLARERGKVSVRERHEVEIKLGASYPRTMPEIRWLTPIYHPNISEIGMVCLGGYGTHWVPSLNLDELCGMLWDMARYHNYDIRSPYNRDAALWVANQTTFKFPMDQRPLRDLRAALGRVAPESASKAIPLPPPSEPATASSASKDAPRDSNLYREFIRKFKANLNQPPTLPPVGSNEHPNGNGNGIARPGGVADPDGFILLDMEVDLRPRPPRPGAGSGEEIVFIE